jgi:hypothetical protein
MGGVMSYIKAGFGLSVGFQLAGILFGFIGLIFFIPGFILFKSELKAGRKGSATEIFGIVLMIIGAILMGGFGLGSALSGINDMTN